MNVRHDEWICFQTGCRMSEVPSNHSLEAKPNQPSQKALTYTLDISLNNQALHYIYMLPSSTVYKHILTIILLCLCQVQYTIFYKYHKLEQVHIWSYMGHINWVLMAAILMFHTLLLFTIINHLYVYRYCNCSFWQIWPVLLFLFLS